MNKKRLAKMLGIKPENIAIADVNDFESMVHGQMVLLKEDYELKSDRRAVAQETVTEFMLMCMRLKGAGDE